MQYGDGTQATLGDIVATKRMEEPTSSGMRYSQTVGVLADNNMLSPYWQSIEFAGFGKQVTPGEGWLAVDLSDCTKVA